MDQKVSYGLRTTINDYETISESKMTMCFMFSSALRKRWHLCIHWLIQHAPDRPTGIMCSEILPDEFPGVFEMCVDDVIARNSIRMLQFDSSRHLGDNYHPVQIILSAI